MKLSIIPQSPPRPVSPRPTTSPVSHIEKELDVDYAQLVFVLLEECIEGRITEIIAKYGPTEGERYIRDLYFYSDNNGLSNMTSPDALRRILAAVQDEHYAPSRENFLFKTTQYLRLQLGSVRWSRLTEDIANALSIMAPEANAADRGFSPLNRSINSPRVEQFRADYWLVTYALLAIYPKLPTIIARSLADLAAATKKRRPTSE